MMDECKINIIWKLGQEGPLSIYRLGVKEKYSLPKVWSEIPRIEGAPERKEGEKCMYEYAFIHKKVRELVKSHLVTTSTSKRKEPSIVELTFLGLYVYLLGSMEEDKFARAINHHSSLLRFSGLWWSLVEKLGEKKVNDALDSAVKDFKNLALVKCKIKSLNLEFEGFVRNRMFPTVKAEVVRERDATAVELLKRKEGSTLRKSYITYLAVQDLMRLSRQSKTTVKELLPHLESEKELAYFESRKPNSNNLFEGNRLGDFFPEYASAEWFLTGMFVENLLWNEKPTEKGSEEFDYEVELQKCEQQDKSVHSTSAEPQIKPKYSK